MLLSVVVEHHSSSSSPQPSPPWCSSKCNNKNIGLKNTPVLFLLAKYILEQGRYFTVESSLWGCPVLRSWFSFSKIYESRRMNEKVSDTSTWTVHCLMQGWLLSTFWLAVLNKTTHYWSPIWNRKLLLLGYESETASLWAGTLFTVKSCLWYYFIQII